MISFHPAATVVCRMPSPEKVLSGLPSVVSLTTEICEFWPDPAVPATTILPSPWRVSAFPATG